MEKSYEQNRIEGALNILKDLNNKVIGLIIISIWRLFTYENTNYYIVLSVYLLLILTSIYILSKHWANKITYWDLKIAPLKDIFITVVLFSFNVFLLYLGIYKGLWKAIEFMFSSEIDFSWMSLLYRLAILFVGIYSAKDFNNVQGLINMRNQNLETIKKYL